MKKIFFLAVLTSAIYFGCNKKNDLPSSQTTVLPNTLVAHAGNDTFICMPYSGTGNIFKCILDGRASQDNSGNIVSYSWIETGSGFPSVVLSQKDSSAVTLSGGTHEIVLEVRDDQGHIANDKIMINVFQNFEDEYDGLSWDSTAGALKTIRVIVKPALIETWPDFTYAEIDKSHLYLSDYNGKCNDISTWKDLPFVPYDSIQLTGKPVFYTLVTDLPNSVNFLTMYPEIFAKTNSGIDFTKKVSAGFIVRSPWDY